MRRTSPIVAGVCAIAFAVGAKDSAEGLAVWGIGIALLVLAGLPAALLLQSWRPGVAVAVADAVDRRKTACMLLGAALVITLLLAFAVLEKIGPAAPALCVAVAAGWGLVGFAGCSRRTGLRLFGMPPDGSVADARRIRPLVVGWLVRCGALAVPFAWPLVLVYLTLLALGAPLVALTGRWRKTG